MGKRKRSCREGRFISFGPNGKHKGLARKTLVERGRKKGEGGSGGGGSSPKRRRTAVGAEFDAATRALGIKEGGKRGVVSVSNWFEKGLGVFHRERTPGDQGDRAGRRRA